MSKLNEILEKLGYEKINIKLTKGVQDLLNNAHCLMIATKPNKTSKIKGLSPVKPRKIIRKLAKIQE